MGCGKKKASRLRASQKKKQSAVQNLLRQIAGLLSQGEARAALKVSTRLLAGSPLLKLPPEYCRTVYQVGLLFFEEQQVEEAKACFTAVLAAQPANVDACFNLALCEKALGRSAAAIVCLRRAARLAPFDADIIYNIGVLQREQGESAEATFLKALEMDPTNGICLTDLAILYHGDNRLEEARYMYGRALACGYRPDSAHHMLAALNGQTTVSAPPSHIRDLFNNYAGNFDHSLLHDLEYTVPGRLAQLFSEGCLPSRLASLVDLGCGTGLAGLAFRPLAHHLTGVDLAENMLTLAAEKQVYDRLYCADIMGFLGAEGSLYDLALATDVFVYLGELTLFFQLMAQRLTAGGFLLFSVESCGEKYCLRQSGRYAHAPEYIARLADRYSFVVRQQQAAGIRKERGEWIPGELYILQRSQ